MSPAVAGAVAPARGVPGTGEIRIARIIGRLNIGGPAIQAITMTRELEPLGYRTLLLRGVEAEHEGSMDHLAQELGVRPVLVPGMQREIGPGELPALARLVAHLRRFRPHLVHTHAAKAGTLGRAAAVIASGPRRPAIVHTFHGHSLEEYFSPIKARAFLEIERSLARASDRLIAVSPEVRDDLVRLRVAAPERFTVIPLGFDLSRFDLRGPSRAERRAAKRAQWGVGPDEVVVTLVARLVPIKRVDRFLRVAELLAREPPLRFVIVGDGELGEALRSSDAASRLGERVVWTGFDKDIPSVYAASDCVALTSDNEGTPVSLIEAQAAGLGVVSTSVGGVASAVRDGVTGVLVNREDHEAFAAAVRAVLADGGRMGEAGREAVFSRFSQQRLVRDLHRLYGEVLASRTGARFKGY
jgi:glycosyltransferase involved in cell wall biosynthesis